MPDGLQSGFNILEQLPTQILPNRTCLDVSGMLGHRELEPSQIACRDCLGRGADRYTPCADGLNPADWQAVADHLKVSSGPAGDTDAVAQFEVLAAEQGLKWIIPVAEQ